MAKHPGLILVRSFLLVALLVALLYHFVPSVELWCQQRWDTATGRVREQYAKLRHFVNDERYHVPKERRDPGVSMKEFYSQPSHAARQALPLMIGKPVSGLQPGVRRMWEPEARNQRGSSPGS